ncbi:MAG: trypsin-like serine protease [Myxococcales bacterium]
MRQVVLAALALCPTFAACGETGLHEPAITEALGSEAVGDAVDRHHAAVGLVRRDGQDLCVGTLVGPKTVLTAAHCVAGSGASKTEFVVDGQAYLADETVAHPLWSPEADGGEGAHDVAVLRLAHAPPMEPSPIAVREPRVGQHLTLVGFAGSGTRRVTYNALSVLGPAKLYFTAASEVGTVCRGDSGSPAFVRDGDVDVLVGVSSGGVSPCEWSDTWHTRVDRFASWIADRAAGDVVPAELGAGPGLGATEVDVTRPFVHVTMPKPDAELDAGTVVVKALATDDTGIERVELWIDGELRETKVAPAGPYSFVTRLGPGRHQLRVWAYDHAGNASQRTVPLNTH